MKPVILFILIFDCYILSAGIVEKTYYFNHFKTETIGSYQTVNFDNTTLSGLPGEPLLPYHEIVMMLPPGESAESITIINENETEIPGSFLLYPKQYVQPISSEKKENLSAMKKYIRQPVFIPSSQLVI